MDCPPGVDQEKGDKVEGKGKRFLKRNMVSKELIRSILGRYTLPLEGNHGVPHWARVLENGRRLLQVTGARRAVVELFAVFHDSQRINESIDDGHGRRGAELPAINMRKEPIRALESPLRRNFLRNGLSSLRLPR